MAKMFYSLEETAQLLGIDEQAVKDMAAEGKLQQFRDRDQLMFKRDQVDALTGSGDVSSDPNDSIGNTPSLDDSGPLEVVGLDDSGDMPAVSPDDSDAVDLAKDAAAITSEGDEEDVRERTGISVFDTNEIDAADPMAQTQVTDSVMDEDLSLDGIGSGSGLLDLTRESDDTSLGAVLDDVAFSSGEGSDLKFEEPSGLAANFDSAAFGSQIAGSGIAEQTSIEEHEEDVPEYAQMPTMAPSAYDPAGSGMGAGFLLGTLATLILAMIIAVGAMADAPTALLSMMSGGPYTPAIWAAGLLVLSVVFGVVGFVIGKAATR